MPPQTLLMPASHTTFQNAPPHIIDEGRTAYENLKARQDSPCWRVAFGTLDNNCSDLKLSDKQRLALALAYCHLTDASRPMGKCNAGKDVQSCLASVRDDSTFNTYTQFFIAVDQICFYLQQQEWQQSTEKLVQDLDATAKQSVKLQTDISSMSGTILTEVIQTHSVVDGTAQAAEKTQSHMTELQNKIQELQGELHVHAEASAALHHSTQRQTREMMHVIDGMHEFTAGLSTAWSRVTSSWYLLFCLNLAWLLTTITPTRRARGWLFLQILFQVMLETALQFLQVEYSPAAVRVVGVGSAVLTLLIGTGLHVHSLCGRIRDCGQVLAVNGHLQPEVELCLQLEQMSRKELVQLAKDNGVKGNLSSKVMIEQLKTRL